MGKDKNAELEQHFYETVKSIGYRWLDFDSRWMDSEARGGFMIKRVSYKRVGKSWRIIVTADGPTGPVVQFADVETIGGSGGKLLSLFQQPIWKVDQFSKPTPLQAEGVDQGPLTRPEK